MDAEQLLLEALRKQIASLDRGVLTKLRNEIDATLKGGAEAQRLRDELARKTAELVDLGNRLLADLDSDQHHK